MRIGVTSNTTFNTMAMKLRVNTHLSPLEKQKLQLQEQIKKVEESKASKESKKSSIEELQKKLEEVGDQLAKEKLEKPNKESEDVKSKDKKDDHQKVTEENKEGEESSQVINEDVIIGITSASSHQKIGKIAYSVYRGATARGDMATAERALKYTTAEIKKSAESRKLIERGLKEYKKQMESIKRINTEKVTNDSNITENDNNVVNSEERTIANEMYESNTSRVVGSGNSETKSSVKERLE